MEENGLFTYKRIEKTYSLNVQKSAILHAESEGLIPKAKRVPYGGKNRTQRAWPIESVVKIGERYGYIKKLEEPKIIAVFTTKGGVLKSTIALNMARTFALHNIKTLVIGLDMQMDISGALGISIGSEEDDLEELQKRLNSIDGLCDYFQENCSLEDTIQNTDLPTLDFIPETSDLVALNDLISTQNRREDWLKNNVINKIRNQYDLIILDCSPNWNMLVTNALASCDLLLCPIECKINHYRNLPYFLNTLKNFKQEVSLNFDTLFVPTKFSATKKLSNQIKRHYFNTMENCSSVGIRESVIGEEAMAQCISMQEYQPSKVATEEMKELMMLVNERLLSKTIH